MLMWMDPAWVCTVHVTKIDEVGVARPSDILSSSPGPVAPGLLRSNLSIQKLKL